jgi:uncharacterized Tic20 family protein
MLAVVAGFGLMWVDRYLALVGLIFTFDRIVMASVNAWSGEGYEYPLSLCLLQNRA